MTAQFPLTADLIQAFGWALLHSFWQALLVYACLRLVLLLWPHASASTKYNLSYISLAGIFCWFLITLWQQLQSVKKIYHAAQMMIITGVRPKGITLSPIYHRQQEISSMIPGLEAFFPILAIIYVLGVVAMTAKLTMDLLHLRQIRRKLVLPIDEVWEKHLGKLKLQLQLSKKVKLLISEHIQVPVMIGFFKPLIILPVIMFNNLTAEQLEAILLHELAHVKRNDYLLNIFQSIIETILFFNPFVWLISKSIRIEREHCCDDLVIAGKVQPLHYAKALVALEEYRLTVNALAMAAADNKQHLFHRIKRIMEMKTKNINYTQKLLAVLIIAVGLVSIAWLNPSNAKAESKKPVDKNAVYQPIAPAIVANPIQIGNYISDTTKPSRNRNAADNSIMQTNMQAAQIGMDAAKAAMENINWNQINADVSAAMKNVDWESINKNVQTAMNSIDWHKINADIKLSMDSLKFVNTAAIQESIRIGMASASEAMNSPEFKKGMAEGMAKASEAMNSEEFKKAMREGMEQARAAMNSDEVKKAMKDGMEQARKEMAAAQLQMQSGQHYMNMGTDKGIQKKYKKMIAEMTADKLIDPTKGYTITKKEGIIKINDEVQPASVTKKYKSYFDDADEIAITGKEDNLMISEND